MAERRNKFEIICDILALIQRQGKIKPTHILYKGNLSYDRMKSYITELENKGMIQEIKEKEKSFYIITEKGARLVEEAKKIKELREAFGL